MSPVIYKCVVLATISPAKKFLANWIGIKLFFTLIIASIIVFLYYGVGICGSMKEFKAFIFAPSSGITFLKEYGFSPKDPRNQTSP